MRKTTWDKELTFIFLAKFYRNILSECRRTFSYINRDIKNLPLNDSYKFRL